MNRWDTCRTVYGSPDTGVKSGEVPTFIVLAGACRLRRVSLAKGLIRLANNETVVESLLKLSLGPAFVVTNEPEWYERLEVPLVADMVPDKGAPGGLVTGLAIAATEWVAVVACDMPFVTAPMLETLSERRHSGVDVVCFTREGQLEPLVGFYRRTLCFDWAPRLEGNPSLRELLLSTRLDTVEAPEPRRLVRLDSPEDFAKATESFSSSTVAGSVASQAPW